MQSARLNDVDPQALLADVLVRIAKQLASWLDELLPWNWKLQRAHRSLSQLRSGLHRMATLRLTVSTERRM